jgi:hypothetical protein
MARSVVWLILIGLLMFDLLLLPVVQSLIFSTIYAGPRKYKTISFEKWYLKPIAYSKRRKFAINFHKQKLLRRPKFKFNVNIPVELPVELTKVPIGGYANQLNNGWS